MKQFDEELVSGSIVRSVWKLAWPIVLLQLVNGVHQLVDHILVGNFVPSSNNAANAAIGDSWILFLVVAVFVASFLQGMTVLIARYSGKQDRETIGRVVYQTLLAAVIFNVFFLAPVGYFLSPWLLTLINAPAGVQVYALPYLRILFVFSIGLFANFMVFNTFQAIGDPKTPLILGIMATTLNVAVSVVLITGVGPFPKLGVVGAAIGTVLSPIPGALIAAYIILSGKTVIQIPHRLSLIPDLSVIKEIVRIGLPTGIQAILLNIGGAILLRYIGSLEHSAAAQAAYTICYAQLFAMVTWASFGLRGAAATLMGQNIGAGNTERGKSTVLVATAMGAVWAMALGVIFYTVPDTLLGFFNAGSGPVLAYGMSLLRVLAFSGFFLSTTLTLTGGMQGAGDTVTPMVIAFLTQIGVLLGLCTMYQFMGLLTAEKIWFAILISHMTRFALTYGAFRHGRWRHARVGLNT